VLVVPSPQEKESRTGLAVAVTVSPGTDAVAEICAHCA
jgi:hypothetical protein